MRCKTGGAPGGGRAVRAVLGVSRWAVVWFALLIFLFVAANSFLFTSYFDHETYFEAVLYQRDNPFVNLGVLAAAAFGLGAVWRARLWQKIPLAWMRRVAVGLAFVLGLGWVFASRTVPIGEAANLSGFAGGFLQGDYSPLEGYLRLFPFQLGYTAFLQGLYALFGAGNFLAAQLVNVAALAVCYHLLVRLAQLLLADDGAACLLCVMLPGCVVPVLYTTFLYPILIGLALALGGMVCAARFVRGGRWSFFAGAVGLCALAVVFKSNYQIVAVAVFLMLLAHTLQSSGGQPAGKWLRAGGWRLLAGLCAFGLCVGLAMQPVYGYYRAKSGVDTVGSGTPAAAWVAMGLQDSILAPGWFNHYTYTALYEGEMDAAKTSQNAMGSIRQSVKGFAQHPPGAAYFFYKKAVSQWNEPTCGALVTSFNAEDEARPRLPAARAVYSGAVARPLLQGWMDAYHLVVYIGAALGLWLGRKKLDIPALMPALVVVGGFVFHMVWEGKSQYIVQYYFLVIPYAAYGYGQLAQWVLAKLPAREEAKKHG